MLPSDHELAAMKRSDLEDLSNSAFTNLERDPSGAEAGLLAGAAANCRSRSGWPVVGGVVLLLLGVLSGSPEPLDEPLNNIGLIEQGSQYAVAGAALWAISWALRRLLGRS
jgi:hypothetical protein